MTTCECGQPARNKNGCDRCQELTLQWRDSESPTRRILRMVQAFGDDWISKPEIADELSISTQRIGWALRFLAERGEVETYGIGSGTRYRAIRRRRAA